MVGRVRKLIAITKNVKEGIRSKKTYRSIELVPFTGNNLLGLKKPLYE